MKPLSPGRGVWGEGRTSLGPRIHPRVPLAARYRFAGILVPAVLVVFFAVTLAEGRVALLGFAANVMLFTVGWHYAKQGYGILMLDAARKGIRFRPAERRRLLWNTHLTWVMYWLVANDALAAKELWGITYYLIDVPDPFLVAMVAAVAVSTLAVGRDLFATWRSERALPLNGLLAYVAAVYVWLAVSRTDPVLLFVTPFFHSLQYLAVVWRYQLNVEADRCGAERRTFGEGMDSGAGGDAAESDRPAQRRWNSAGGAHAGGEGEGRWKAWLRSAPDRARPLPRGGWNPRCCRLLVGAHHRRCPERLRPGRLRRDPLPLHRVDVYQHPPLLHRQRDLAPRQPRGAQVSIHRIRPPRPHRRAGRPDPNRWLAPPVYSVALTPTQGAMQS